MEYNHGTEKEKKQQAQCLSACHDQAISEEANLQAQKCQTQQGCQESLVQGMGVRNTLLKIRNIIRALEDGTDSLNSIQEVYDALNEVHHLQLALIEVGAVLSRVQDDEEGPHSWKPKPSSHC